MTKSSEFRRKVFYICGFDPRSARYYHNLYKEEAKNWSELTGNPLNVSSRKTTSALSCDWQVDNESDNTTCDYTYLVWDDIIRKHWLKHPLGLFLAAIQTYSGLIKEGDWSYLKSLSSGPIKAFLYPVISFIAMIVLTALSTVSVATVASQFLSGSILNALVVLFGLAFSLASGYFFFVKIQSYWLLQLYIRHSPPTLIFPLPLQRKGFEI